MSVPWKHCEKHKLDYLYASLCPNCLAEPKVVAELTKALVAAFIADGEDYSTLEAEIYAEWNRQAKFE